MIIQATSTRAMRFAPKRASRIEHLVEPKWLSKLPAHSPGGAALGSCGCSPATEKPHTGANKNQAHHSLKRAVSFHRLGELRGKTFENEVRSASGPQPWLTAGITL